MKRIMTIALLMTMTVMSYAQTFYEVSFQMPGDDDKYLGLFIYYDDENCKVRLVNNELLAKDQVLESDYVSQTSEKEGDDDTGVMVFAPREEGYPIFVWAWQEDDASDINEKPYVTLDANDTESYFESIYFQEIELKDMDESYVKQFYAEGEEEYELLINGINTVRHNDVAEDDEDYDDDDDDDDDDTPVRSDDRVSPTRDGSTPTFHLLVVANTSVSDIGTACARDLSNIKGEFSAISKVLGMKYDEHIVSGDNYSKANVVKMINNLSPGKDDVVMFVYTGHGFRFDNQTDYYPNIDLTASSYDDVRKNYAPMSDIYESITRKGARLNIVLSDCCNTLLGVESPMVNTNSLFSRANSNFDINKIRSLFLGSQGNVWATAASPGEASWCAVSGGFFLLSFLENLRKQISPLQKEAPSWESLINNAIVSANKKSTSNASCKAQNGVQMVRTKSVKL